MAIGQLRDEREQKRDRIVFVILSVVFFVITITALFGILGRTEVCQTDEATHGINAYEMVKTGSFWAHSLRYKVDYYNSKPPLMLWLIMLGYRIFGFGALGLRFFSALAGLFIYISAVAFAYKSGGRVKALLFAAAFPACGQLFRYHMLRSGDMDSVFALFVLLGVAALYYAGKTPKFLLMFGVAAGLSFLTKSTHASVLLMVGALDIPPLVKKYGGKTVVLHYLGAAVTAFTVVLPWAVMRYRFDGTAFFRAMFVGETAGRLKGNVGNSAGEYFAYALQLVREPVCLISLVLIILAAAAALVRKDVNKDVLISLVTSTDDRYSAIYLELCLTIVTLGAYSAAKAVLDWYIYPAYVPLLLLGADAAVYLFSGMRISVILYTGLFLMSAVISIINIRSYPWKGSGGSPSIALYDDLKELSEKDGFDLSGKKAYIETGFNLSKPEDCWEHDNMFYAYTVLDVLCLDGGVMGFLADSDNDSILILDKNLWDEYAPVLTGFVILEDNSYLIFNGHHYGEENGD